MDTLLKNDSLIPIFFIFYIRTILASEYELLVSPNSPIAYCRNNREMFWNTTEEQWHAEDCEEFHNVYYSRRKSPQATFNITSIRIAAVIMNNSYGSYTHEVNYTIENGKYRFTGGFLYEAFKYIAESYNLGIIADKSRNYAATRHDSNITTDIGTMLTNDECDVAISVHEYNVVRLAKFSYLHPHIHTRLTIYFMQPPASSIRNIYHYVFKLDSWAAVLLTWVIAICTVWGITFVKKITSSLQDNENQSLIDIFLWAVAVACQNGVTINPEALSLKIALLCTLLTGLFIYLVYSAAIVSILAWDVVPIKNVSDMVYLGFNFYSTTDSLSPKVATYMEVLKKEAPQLANAGKIISIDPFVAFEKIMTEDKTSFMSLDELYILKGTDAHSGKYNCKVLSRLFIDGAPITQAMIVKKGSRWREYLNIKLLWEMNNGILHRIMTTYRKVVKQCSQDRQSQHEIKSLGWTDIFSAVIILLILYAVSLLFFIAEKLFPPIVNSKDDRQGRYKD